MLFFHKSYPPGHLMYQQLIPHTGTSRANHCLHCISYFYNFPPPNLTNLIYNSQLDSYFWFKMLDFSFSHNNLITLNLYASHKFRRKTWTNFFLIFWAQGESWTELIITAHFRVVIRWLLLWLLPLLPPLLVLLWLLLLLMAQIIPTSSVVESVWPRSSQSDWPVPTIHWR